MDAGDTRASECGGANLSCKLARSSKLCTSRVSAGCVKRSVQKATRWVEGSQVHTFGKTGSFDYVACRREVDDPQSHNIDGVQSLD